MAVVIVQKSEADKQRRGIKRKNVSPTELWAFFKKNPDEEKRYQIFRQRLAQEAKADLAYRDGRVRGAS